MLCVSLRISSSLVQPAMEAQRVLADALAVQLLLVLLQL